jgi:hypothetical protein
VGAPGDQFAGEQKLGDGSAVRIFIPSTFDEDGYPDPDVAVVEPGEKALMLPDCRPYDEDSIGFFGSDQPSERLLLAGIPEEMTFEHERIDRGPGRGGLRRLDLYLSGMEVHTMPRIRWPQEPPAGRGVHVFISPQAEDRKRGGVSLTPAPEGTSGGPLARHDGRLLVGLARACEDFEDGLDQWYEPVVEAVRLLLHHQDRRVAAAARRIVRRCARLRMAQGHGRKR